MHAAGPARQHAEGTVAPPDGHFRFVALDVETACGDSASICQVGLACVDVRDGIHTWSTLVDPLQPFAPFNTALHGIGADTVRGAPSFAQLWPLLLPLLARQPLVQHSRFDERAINAACRAHGLARPRLSWHDSVTIARAAWPELKGNGATGWPASSSTSGLTSITTMPARTPCGGAGRPAGRARPRGRPDHPRAEGPACPAVLAVLTPDARAPWRLCRAARPGGLSAEESNAGAATESPPGSRDAMWGVICLNSVI